MNISSMYYANPQMACKGLMLLYVPKLIHAGLSLPHEFSLLGSEKVDLQDFIHLPLLSLNETWKKLNLNKKSHDRGDLSKDAESRII